MNYFLLLVGAYMALTNSRNIGSQQNITLWRTHMAEHNKHFETPEIEFMRRSIFFYNKQQVDEHNKRAEAGDFSYELALNELADLSSIEIKARNGFRMPEEPELLSQVQRNTPEAQKYLESILGDNSIEVPESVDWRTVAGRVTNVKNQGNCGSCWAFSATGALEGQEITRHNKTNDQLTELSEQNILDCSTKDMGCNGGIMQDAFDLVKSEGGIDTEQAYPYEEHQSECRYNQSQSVMNDNGFVLFPEGDEDTLKQMVAKFGPVSVAIDASDFRFQLYHRGVYYNKHCGKKMTELDHGVLVVGYGTDPKHGDYWIVKNSWGKMWGDHGYIKMARNRSNNCGIATNAVIPIIQ